MTNDERQTENLISFERAAAPPDNANAELSRESSLNQPHWSVLSAVGFLILSIAAIVVLPGIAVSVYAVVKKIPLENLISDPNVIAVNLLAIFPAHLLTMFVGWRLVTRNGRQPFFQTLGWRWTRGFNFWTCLLLSVALLLLSGLIAYLYGTNENELQRILASSYTARVLTALMAALTAPLVEETVYRGVLYPAFERKFTPELAVALVTLAFALVHVPQYVDFNKMQEASNYSTISVILLLSLVLTLIRAKTKSLLPCFVIHTLFNGIQAVILVVEPFLPKGEAPTPPPAPGWFW